MALDSIPVVDFSAYSLDRDQPDPEHYQTLIDQVYDACTTIGFIYIKNSGIPKEKVDRCFDASRKFFQLNQEVKVKYELPREYIHGYICMERESVARTGTVTKGKVNRPHGDIREGYNCNPLCDHPQAWPDEDAPEFRESVDALQEASKPFILRLLEVLGKGLKLEDPHYFTKAHEKSGSTEGSSVFRSNYYPAPDTLNVKENQVRCEEHTDFVSLTLLWQREPGLEVQNFNGDWIPAPPIDDTIVINIGDTMQRWTSDKLVSTKHRVANSVTESLKRCIRQTLSYFINPDQGTIIRCIDGSDKYQPISVQDFLHQQYNKIQPY